MGEAKPKRLKAYICNNYDGRQQAMVAAPNLDGAAKSMRTSASDMRKFGWRFAKDDAADLALRHPGIVFFAGIMAPKPEWTPKEPDAARSTEEGE
jgi:hypothetical protein